jgi:hypothetical protein
MGGRIIEKPDLRTARKNEARAIATICAAIMGPMLLTYLLIAADMRSDLSGLKSRPADARGGAVLVGWKDLEMSDEAGRKQRTAELPGGRARMLGYMMDGYQTVQDGTAVRMFILMPEAGQLLHPAHRIPDEMVEVWLDGGRSVPYTDRKLVWVEGNLRKIRQKTTGGHACYAIGEATVEHASERDITRWFAH